MFELEETATPTHPVAAGEGEDDGVPEGDGVTDVVGVADDVAEVVAAADDVGAGGTVDEGVGDAPGRISLFSSVTRISSWTIRAWSLFSVRCFRDKAALPSNDG